MLIHLNSLIKTKIVHFMKEKILALLTTKFAGVRKDGLAQLAGVLSLQAADEAEATAILEKLTSDKVNDFIKDWRKDVDKEVSEANKTYESNLKKKFDFIEKKSDPNPNPNPNPKIEDDDLSAIIAAAVKSAVDPLQKEINAFKSGKTAETRLQQIEAKFKDVPESYKAQRLADARLIVNSLDDDQFAEYSTRLDTDIVAFNQELTDKGLAGQGKPLFGKQNVSEEDDFINSMKVINSTDKKD